MARAPLSVVRTYTARCGPLSLPLFLPRPATCCMHAWEVQASDPAAAQREAGVAGRHREAGFHGPQGGTARDPPSGNRVWGQSLISKSGS